MHLINNPNVDREAAYGPALQAILNEQGFATARAEISTWPDYAPTPLVSLPGLAAEAGLGAVWYKDEGGRFGLGSFKALGGAYAVSRLVGREGAGITVCSATDGNHGRSVAWGARTRGCACVIYIHATVSEGRKAAIEDYGAEVRRIRGNYDDSVRVAAEDAEANGWHVVSDTSWDGYGDIPRDVMHGYGVMVAEAIEQLPAGETPSHVFVQGGVGGLGAAVLAMFWQRYGAARPCFIVAEPENAACLYESAKAGRRTVVAGDLDTVMAGLAAGEVSHLAWDILRAGCDGFMTVADDDARQMMRRLGEGDPPIVAGESAVAGLVAALAARRAEAFGLDGESSVLVIGSEGATDPALYAEITGRTADRVGKQP
ncbi:MAG: diaminopropionate ammonia-lyase [Proteobacteria bacterium]|nr:diaminopropionate ammonia-lyase [Pseudomonadota bacterium]